jgi:hypothetical protein
MKRRDLIATALAAPQLLLAGCASPGSPSSSGNPDPTKTQITVLYDAFGRDPALQKDWGYAAFVEFGGKRILFDTGNNPEVLAKNAALGSGGRQGLSRLGHRQRVGSPDAGDHW